MLRWNSHNYNHGRFKNNKTVTCKSMRSKNVVHCSHIFNKLIFLHIQRQTHKTQRLSACPSSFTARIPVSEFFFMKTQTLTLSVLKARYSVAVMGPPFL
jgi:hypothetical protein